jgi:hypothetical protein
MESIISMDNRVFTLGASIVDLVSLIISAVVPCVGNVSTSGGLAHRPDQWPALLLRGYSQPARRI